MLKTLGESEPRDEDVYAKLEMERRKEEESLLECALGVTWNWSWRKGYAKRVQVTVRVSRRTSRQLVLGGQGRAWAARPRSCRSETPAFGG